MLVDGRTFATALIAVNSATGDNSHDPQTYKTTCAEFYPDGVRLICWNHRVLLSAWVPAIDGVDRYEGANAPGLEELPVSTVTVGDYDARVAGLAKFARKLTKGQEEEKTEPIDMRLTVIPMLPRSPKGMDAIPQTEAEAETDPALLVSRLRIEILGERAEESIVLRGYAGAFMNWRPLFDRPPLDAGAPVNHIGHSAAGLAEVAKLADVFAAGVLRFDFDGLGGNIAVTMPTAANDLMIEGLLVPVPLKADEPPAPAPSEEDAFAEWMADEDPFGELPAAKNVIDVAGRALGELASASSAAEG